MLTLPQVRWQHRWLPLLVLLMLTGWLLIACERTLPDTNESPAPDQPVAELPQETDPIDQTPVEESPPVGYPEPEAEATPEPVDTPREEETTEEPETDESEEVEEAVEEAEEAADPPPTMEEATPTVHTVARGESLYRIGLQYGVSWVRLAQFNNITNPNRITVGQQLRIPGPSDPIPQPTPSPHTETTYIVKAGDNLYRISLIYGISWVQIAEANGLVNPNQIVVGQELKIPVEATGPAPQFTHTVRAGETLFRISLRYGIPWPVIAEANGLESPYVIYVGQTLVIPGG
ncbi:MAG: LysM peptidoglycan-binding domain-containing protein [Chloroflexota bacterium]